MVTPNIRHRATVEDYAYSDSESDRGRTRNTDAKKRARSQSSDSSESHILQGLGSGSPTGNKKQRSDFDAQFRRQTESESRKFQSLLENFGENREKIFEIVNKTPYLTRAALCDLAHSQIDLTNSPETGEIFKSVSVLFFAKDDAQKMACVLDINRIGEILLQRMNESGPYEYGLLDKAKILEASILLKKISEQCAFANEETLDRLGFNFQPFNTFEPKYERLLSAMAQVGAEAQVVYQTRGSQISLSVAPVIDQAILHVVPMLYLAKNKESFWAQLLSMAEMVFPPEIEILDNGENKTPSEHIAGEDLDKDEVNSQASNRMDDFKSDRDSNLDLDELAARTALREQMNSGTKNVGALLTAGLAPEIDEELYNQDTVHRKALPSINQEEMSLVGRSAETSMILAQVSKPTWIEKSANKLTLLKIIAAKMPILDADQDSTSDVRLRALERLGQVEANLGTRLSPDFAEEWKQFLCHLAFNGEMFSSVSEEGTKASRTDREKAAEILGESLNTLTENARLYEKQYLERPAAPKIGMEFSQFNTEEGVEGLQLGELTLEDSAAHERRMVTLREARHAGDPQNRLQRLQQSVDAIMARLNPTGKS